MRGYTGRVDTDCSPDGGSASNIFMSSVGFGPFALTAQIHNGGSECRLPDQRSVMEKRVLKIHSEQNCLFTQVQHWFESLQHSTSGTSIQTQGPILLVTDILTPEPQSWIRVSVMNPEKLQRGRFVKSRKQTQESFIFYDISFNFRLTGACSTHRCADAGRSRSHQETAQCGLLNTEHFLGPDFRSPPQ